MVGDCGKKHMDRKMVCGGKWGGGRWELGRGWGGGWWKIDSKRELFERL